MKVDVSDRGLATVFGLLSGGGHEARLVGGAVRDMLRGERPKDMDVATDALPERVVALATAAGHRVIETGLRHGTVTVMANGVPYEVTTLRMDVETDGRHARVEYISDFKADASRRDFTINAMSADPSGKVFDYFGGHPDLVSGTVRFVGVADDRIAEDYLRILRFFRFRARFGAPGKEGDIEAVRRGVPGLARISAERIWNEVSRIVALPRGMEQVSAMRDTGVARAIGLEFDPSRLSAAAKAVAAGASPGSALGVLLADEGRAERLVLSWKTSNPEAQDMAVAASVASSPESSPGYWLGMAADGIPVDRLAPVLAATGREDAAAALRRGVPVFPLRGRDLVDSGFEAGPALGAMLAQARAQWKDSGFSATREDLLSALGAISGRRP